MLTKSLVDTLLQRRENDVDGGAHQRGEKDVDGGAPQQQEAQQQDGKSSSVMHTNGMVRHPINLIALGSKPFVIL